MSAFVVARGDARRLPLANNSVDAVVTDPPYHLTQVSRGGSARSNGGAGPFSRHKVGARGFMGKTWDGGDVAFDPATWAECYRVLKDGGRMLVFGGSRTHHRIWCAIEDAGFVIEDTIMWLYGSGFPKHKSKLKPAFEPICVARKGATSDLNIDAARIPVADPDYSRNASGDRGHAGTRPDGEVTSIRAGGGMAHDAGRWPANVVLDEEAAAQLDEQSGTLTSGGYPPGGTMRSRVATFGQPSIRGEPLFGASSGGASRFYYCAKPARTERNAGLEGMPKRVSNKIGQVKNNGSGELKNGTGLAAPAENHHPTVKPVDLMRWLVRLVTKPGDVVLDAFTGSGTTGVACMREARRFIGIELSDEYATIAQRRIAAAPLNLFAEGA